MESLRTSAQHPDGRDCGTTNGLPSCQFPRSPGPPKCRQCVLEMQPESWRNGIKADQRYGYRQGTTTGKGRSASDAIRALLGRRPMNTPRRRVGTTGGRETTTPNVGMELNTQEAMRVSRRNLADPPR